MENFLDKILKVKPLVLKMLIENEDCRDDDNLLLIKVWEFQSSDKINTYESFKKLLIDGLISTPESITRTRRKLQEDNIELRGKLYEERRKQEKIVRNQLKIDF